MLSAGYRGWRGVGLAAWVGAAVFSSARAASAHGDVDEERPTRAAPSAPPSVSTAAPTPPPPPSEGGPSADALSSEARSGSAESTRGEREDKASVRLDLVLGWGRVPFALQNLPTSGMSSVTYTRADGVNTNVQSLLLGGSFELTEHVKVGLRLPLTFAGFSPDGSAGRSTTSVGNLELGGEYVAFLTRRLRIIGSLGVTLPTAQGTEIPRDLSGGSASLSSTRRRTIASP